MNADSRKFYDALVSFGDDVEEIYLGMVSFAPDNDGDGPWTFYHFAERRRGWVCSRGREIGMAGVPRVDCVYRALIELEASHGIRHNVSDEAIACVVRHAKTPRELLMEQT